MPAPSPSALQRIKPFRLLRRMPTLTRPGGRRPPPFSPHRLPAATRAIRPLPPRLPLAGLHLPPFSPPPPPSLLRGGDAGRREGGGGRQGGGAGEEVEVETGEGGGAGEGRGGGGGREGGDGANLDGWIWSGEGDAAMGMEAGRWRSRWSPARRFRDGGRDGDGGGARASGFGRLASSRTRIDKTMMDELKEVKKAVNPAEILLVVDAMTGQEAAALVTTFNIEIGVTGAILTKLDGDSRGGAALSVKEVSGKPIKFVGRGERMEDLELFYPDQMAQRVLGMEDVLSFVEKAQEVMCQEDAVELQKIMSAKFDFNDFLKQTQNVAKMGSMSRVIGMIPGMNKVTPAQIREAKKRLALVESMINAMTAEERERPELLAESRERRMRMAEESGKTEQEVSQLVAQLFQMRAQMQKLMGMMQGQEAIPGMGDLMESIKADEKAPPGTARRKRRHGKPRQRELDAVGGVSRF